MESKKKLFAFMVLFLFLGEGIGFYFGKNFERPKTIEITNEIKNPVNKKTNITSDTSKQNVTLQKLDLLKSYTDFILLPKETIADPTQYANDMGEKVMAINDNEITIRFYATGEADNKEQKIINFLDYLNESIKADFR